MLNIHHLELFYYVATHGGISRAVRKIPYGIQQPAVSGQMTQLEEGLGMKLFERMPFRLTPAGERLYAHVAPFFNQLPSLEEKLRAEAVPVLRIGASELLLRHFLPGMIVWLKGKEPKLKITLRSGYQHRLEQMIEGGELDLALVPIDSKPSKRIKTHTLIKVPLVLQVPKDSPIKSAAELWERESLDEPLVALPETESVVRNFRRFLAKRKIHWPTSIEASSLDAITAYVANGYGIGLNSDTRQVAYHPNIRVLPLDGVDPQELVVMWSGQPTGLLAELLKLLKNWFEQTPNQALILHGKSSKAK